MGLDAVTAKEKPAGKGDGKRDPFASFCARIPMLPAGDRAALRRLFLTRSDQAVGVVTGLLLGAGVPEPEWRTTEAFARWELLAHVAAVLSGTAAIPPHQPGITLGRALHEARYSDNRLRRLTGARGPALADQIVRAARVLAAAGKAPVDLRPLRRLSFDTGDGAEAARLAIARDYYAAAYASTKDAP